MLLLSKYRLESVRGLLFILHNSWNAKTKTVIHLKGYYHIKNSPFLRYSMQGSDVAFDIPKTFSDEKGKSVTNEGPNRAFHIIVF